MKLLDRIKRLVKKKRRRPVVKTPFGDIPGYRDDRNKRIHDMGMDMFPPRIQRPSK